MGKERRLTVFLSIIWALTILYGEMFAYWVPSLWTCSWPHHLRHSSSSSVKRLNDSGDYVKIAVLADPQLMDRTSLHLSPKSLALEIAQFYTDLFMRRAFLLSVLRFKPDVLLFLGDYFDGGPILSDNEWQESLSRLKHIFDLNVLQKTKNMKVYFLSGNHDIGYEALYSKTPEVIRRYEEEFGARNYKFTLGKVDFIAIDSQTLDGNSQGNVTSATWNFIANVSQDSSSMTRVLLTHIPLYRPDWTPCGPDRSSPIINQRILRAPENQQILYQNYVTEKSTNNLLNMISPALILSGHDHDQCKVTHIAKHGPVEEHTIGTISWQQGNLFPSFMLLSASNLSSPDGLALEDVVYAHLCFLPVQTYIYIWYMVLFIMTLLVVLFWPAKEELFSHYIGNFKLCFRSLFDGSVFGRAIKEKNEDENFEYEMMWDAEGSMHLIKKASKSPPKRSGDDASVERGNAVMRAKRQTEREEVQVAVACDGNVEFDARTPGPARMRTSMTKLVIRRLLRGIRVLSFVAAINVPLYMMLLFKDWVDK
ncbi:unnamed protein product [Coffea canephora]|uniref:Calcineurin-like phosphoesterase domain-containing protein n=2 Tax=Coffea canephora TaxID=49390 RepID=A0A068TP32_COFCA|nr:unnamed protein product [Coffea canephora]